MVSYQRCDVLSLSLEDRCLCWAGVGWGGILKGVVRGLIKSVEASLDTTDVSEHALQDLRRMVAYQRFDVFSRGPTAAWRAWGGGGGAVAGA